MAGYNIESSRKAVQIANQYQTVYAIIGISPNDLEDIPSEEEIHLKVNEINSIFRNNNNKKIVAIGEIGLDFYWNKDNKELQKKMFIEQIRLANELKLPIVIHTRDAVADTLQILKEHPVEKKGIFHCCPLNRELVKEALKLGYYISFSGVITFKNAKNAEEIIKIVPEDKILIETDSPYLAPEPMRGIRNNCMNVKYVAEKIAMVKSKSIDEIARITNQNACKVFQIID